MRSPPIKKAFKITGGYDSHWGSTLSLDHKSGNCYLEDRMTWCLYNLIITPNAMENFDISVIFQQLEDVLATCSQVEGARVDQNVYFCVSDLAAVNQMLEALQPHRPKFRGIGHRDAMTEQRS